MEVKITWNFAKTAGENNWTPGQHGKGMRLADGRELLWKVDEFDGFPTHPQIISKLRLAPWQVAGVTEMHANGSIRPADSSGHSDAWARQLAEQHGQRFVPAWDHPEADGWDFTSKTAVMTAPQQQRQWNTLSPSFDAEQVGETTPNGWSVYRHNNAASVNAVGKQLQNCWQGSNDDFDFSSYHTLHSPDGLPQVAFEVSGVPGGIARQGYNKMMEETLGARNKKPSDEHYDELEQWARDQGIYYDEMARYRDQVSDWQDRVGKIGSAEYQTPEGYEPWQAGKHGRYIVDQNDVEHRWNAPMIGGPGLHKYHADFLRDNPQLLPREFGYITPEGERQSGTPGREQWRFGSTQAWQPGTRGKGAIFGSQDHPQLAAWLVDEDGNPHHYSVMPESGIYNFIALDINEDGGVSVLFGDPSAADIAVKLDPRLHVESYGPYKDGWKFEEDPSKFGHNRSASDTNVSNDDPIDWIGGEYDGWTPTNEPLVKGWITNNKVSHLWPCDERGRPHHRQMVNKGANSSQKGISGPTVLHEWPITMSYNPQTGKYDTGPKTRDIIAEHIGEDKVEPPTWSFSKVAGISRGKKLEILQQADQYHPDSSEIIHQFDDGWTMRKLQNHGDKAREGKLAHHCWSALSAAKDHPLDQPYYSEQYKDTIDNTQREHISLRDPDNWPHASFYREPVEGYDNKWQPLHQFNVQPHETTLLHSGYGHGDSQIAPKYQDRVRQWAQTVPTMNTTRAIAYKKDINDPEPATRTYNDTVPDGSEQQPAKPSTFSKVASNWITPEGFAEWRPGVSGRYIVDTNGQEHRWTAGGGPNHTYHEDWVYQHPELKHHLFGYISRQGEREPSYGSPDRQRDDEDGWVFTASEHQINYTPGQNHKGYIAGDGSIHVWPTDYEGWEGAPHHTEIMEQNGHNVGHDNYGENNPFIIDSEGNIQPVTTAGAEEIEFSIPAHVPGTRVQQGWHFGKTATIPSIDELAQHRYDSECYEVAQAVERQWPHLKADAGFYVNPSGQIGDHAWNRAPDGTIVDMTATQHGYSGPDDEPEVEPEHWPAPKHPEVIHPSHPHHERYVSWEGDEDRAQEIARQRGMGEGKSAAKVGETERETEREIVEGRVGETITPVEGETQTGSRQPRQPVHTPSDTPREVDTFSHSATRSPTLSHKDISPTPLQRPTTDPDSGAYRTEASSTLTSFLSTFPSTLSDRDKTEAQSPYYALRWAENGRERSAGVHVADQPGLAHSTSRVKGQAGCDYGAGAQAIGVAGPSEGAYLAQHTASVKRAAQGQIPEDRPSSKRMVRGLDIRESIQMSDAGHRTLYHNGGQESRLSGEDRQVPWKVIASPRTETGLLVSEHYDHHPLWFDHDEKAVHLGLPGTHHADLLADNPALEEKLVAGDHMDSKQHRGMVYPMNGKMVYEGPPEAKPAVEAHLGKPLDLWKGWHFGSESHLELPEGYREPDMNDPEDTYKGLELKDGRSVYWALYGHQRTDQTAHAYLMEKMGIKPEQVARYLDSTGREPELRSPEDQQFYLDNVKRIIERKNAPKPPPMTSWNFSNVQESRLSAKIVQVPTPSDISHKGYTPAIHDVHADTLYVGSPGSSHASLIKFTPELDYNPYAGSQGIDSSSYRHGQMVDGKFQAFDPWGEKEQHWDFTASEPQGTPAEAPVPSVKIWDFPGEHNHMGEDHDRPWAYSPRQNIVHVGPPNSYHTDLRNHIVENGGPDIYIGDHMHGRTEYITNRGQRKEPVIEALNQAKIPIGYKNGWHFAATEFPAAITPENEISRIALPAQPWQKGMNGKGLIHNGQPYLWKSEPRSGDPHHPDILMHLDKNYDGRNGMATRTQGAFYVRPDGEVIKAAPWGYESDSFATSHPDLYAKPQTDWNFSKVDKPDRISEWKFSMDSPWHNEAHYNEWTGKVCNCPWGGKKHRQSKTAGQELNRVLKAPDKAYQTPEGEAFRKDLPGILGEEHDALAPYIAQRWKKGDIMHAPYPSDAEGQERPGYLTYAGQYGPQRVPLNTWNQWIQAKQHPTRQGVNFMAPDFTPQHFQEAVDNHQQQLRHKELLKNGLDQGDVVHQFPNGWHIRHITAPGSDIEQAMSAEGQAMGHCIGQDEQPYKNAAHSEATQVYSLRDKQGFPHGTWHTDPEGNVAEIHGNDNKRLSPPQQEMYEQWAEKQGVDPRPNGYDFSEYGDEEQYDDEITVPGARDVDEYLDHFHPDSDRYYYEDAERHGNQGPETEINVDDPDWDSIVYDLTNKDRDERENVYNTAHHNSWDYHDPTNPIPIRGQYNDLKYHLEDAAANEPEEYQHLLDEFNQNHAQHFDRDGKFKAPESVYEPMKGYRWRTQKEINDFREQRENDPNRELTIPLWQNNQRREENSEWTGEKYDPEIGHRPYWYAKTAEDRSDWAWDFEDNYNGWQKAPQVWEPGFDGKGVFLENGRPVVWKTDNEGFPRHDSEGLPNWHHSEGKGYNSTFHVDPKGHAGFHFPEHVEQRHIEALKPLGINLDPSQAAGWRFAAWTPTENDETFQWPAEYRNQPNAPIHFTDDGGMTGYRQCGLCLGHGCAACDHTGQEVQKNLPANEFGSDGATSPHLHELMQPEFAPWHELGPKQGSSLVNGGQMWHPWDGKDTYYDAEPAPAWELGASGKGTFVGGVPHLWAVNKNEEPHHDEAVDGLGHQADGYFYIDPDGAVEGWGEDGRKRADDFAKVHPDLHAPVQEGWSFAKIASKMEWLESRPDKFKDTPEGLDCLKALKRAVDRTPKLDPLTPWLWREMKKGRIEWDDVLTRNQMSHLADWYTSKSPTRKGVDVMQKTWDDVQGLLNQWDEELASQESEANLNNGKVVHQYPNGWTMRELGPQDLQYEGDQMGHCVGGSNYERAVEVGDTTIYSLRDEKNIPHATIELENDVTDYRDGKPIAWGAPGLEQIQGKGNTILKPEYQAMVKEFFGTLPKKPEWQSEAEPIDHIEEIAEPELNAEHGWGGYGPHGDYGLEDPPRATDYESVIDSMLNKPRPAWADDYYDHSHGKELYDHALKRNEIPELAHHVQQYAEETAHPQLMDLHDHNWEYLNYPGEDFEEAHERNPDVIQTQEDFDNAYREYEWAQEDLEKNHAPSQLVSDMYDHLNKHYNQETGKYENPGQPGRLGPPTVFSRVAFEKSDDDLHNEFLERSKNQPTDQDILNLLTPQPKRGVAQKGLELPDWSRYFWTPDEMGFPHHDEVAQILKATKDTIPLEVSPDGKITEAHDYSDMDWSL